MCLNFLHRIRRCFPRAAGNGEPEARPCLHRAMVEKYGRFRIDNDRPPSVTTAIVPGQTQQRRILKSERPMTRYRRHFVVDARDFAEAEPLRASRQPTHATWRETLATVHTSVHFK
jgi:hypothetical protein